MRISKSKLDLALARKCWNQRALRENCNISAQTLINVNAGKSVLPSTVGKIAHALGVDVAEIIEKEK